MASWIAFFFHWCPTQNMFCHPRGFKITHHILNNDRVKANAIILLTAADKQRAGLGIEREFPQVHGTSGFDRQPVTECEIQQDWTQ
jgi:hypothetical protein